MDIQLLPASAVDIDEFIRAFNLAYSDYQVSVHLDGISLRNLMERTSIHLEASCVAKVGNQVGGVGLLGIRGQRGWIGGLGVIPEQRGLGLGRQIMLALQKNAQERGLQQLQLEVIQGNLPAYRLYQALGFTTRRELLIIKGQGQKVPADAAFEIRRLLPAEVFPYHGQFSKTIPPWQLEPIVFKTIQGDLQARVALQNNQVVAYGLLWMSAQTLRWLALEGDLQSATALIHTIHHEYPAAIGSFINLPAEAAVWPAFAAAGYTIDLIQFEMHLPLDAV